MRAMVATILFLIFNMPSYGGQRDLDMRSEIWERFRFRQAAGETMQVAWMKDHVRVGGAALRVPRPIKAEESLPQDFVYPSHRSRLILSQDLVRYEDVIPSYVATDGRGGVRSLETAEIVPSIAAFDGDRQQSFTAPTTHSGPNGRIYARKEFDEWNSIHLLPVILAVRPLRKEAVGESSDGWEIEDRSAVIDGVSCIVLRSLEKHRFVRRLYLDPERDYIPLRYTSEIAERPHAEATMRYDRTEAPLWFPSSWTATYYYFPSDLRSFERSNNEVEHVVLSESVPGETFTIKYPSGTDLTTENVPGLASRMIVVDDGSWVPLRKVIADTSLGSFRWPWFLAAIGAFALGVGLLYWKRYAASG